MGQTKKRRMKIGKRPTNFQSVDGRKMDSIPIPINKMVSYEEIFIRMHCMHHL